jgi:hypothetical protein
VGGGWPEVGALDWGKPLAGGGGHNINDTVGTVLLLEVDIEVYSPSLSSLSWVKT